MALDMAGENHKALEKFFDRGKFTHQAGARW